MVGSKEGRLVCLGDPVMDILAHVPVADLETNLLKAGGCEVVSSDQQQNLLANIHPDAPLTSAANVANGLAGLAGSLSNVGFAGRVGKTKEYEESLLRANVEPLLCRSDTEDTATCVCLVTPDGERTMRTCLSAASGLTSIDQLPSGWLHDRKSLHLEGYILYKPQLLKQVLQAAKDQDLVVTMDLGSREVIQHNTETLWEALGSGCIAVVFCNEDEANCIAQIADLPLGDLSPDERVLAAQKHLQKYCKISVVSMGAKGCVARSPSGEQFRASVPVTAVTDTVGAGDYFTAGFLYAYLSGKDLKTCAYSGCFTGSKSVTQSGADFGAKIWDTWRNELNENLHAER